MSLLRKKGQKAVYCGGYTSRLSRLRTLAIIIVFGSNLTELEGLQGPPAAFRRALHVQLAAADGQGRVATQARTAYLTGVPGAVDLLVVVDSWATK